MREMSNSGIAWIGEIPANWTLERLKYHASINPLTTLPSFGSDDTVTFIPMECLKQGFHSSIESDFEKVKKGYVAFQSGDILIAKVTPCFENGNIAIASNLLHDVGFGSTEINVVRCFSMSTRFLFYLLQCAPLIERATYDMYGVAGLKRLSPAFLPNLVIPVPSEDEQWKIVSFLEQRRKEIDSLIVAKEKTNALLKEQRQSLIYEAVTKGLDPTVPMKGSGIPWLGQIPENWTTWRMKHLAESPLQYGANATGIEYDSDLPRYVRITDITDDGRLRNEGKQSLPYEIAADYLLVDGDVLFARSGATSGKSFYYHESDGNCCFAGYLIRFRADKNKVNSKLLYYYTLTQAYEQWTQQIFIQATIQNISAEKYNNLVFAIPATMEEQNQIVQHLNAKCSEIDQIISMNEDTIQRLKEYRQSLIYEAVTGKIEVENV